MKIGCMLRDALKAKGLSVLWNESANTKVVVNVTAPGLFDEEIHDGA